MKTASGSTRKTYTRASCLHPGGHHSMDHTLNSSKTVAPSLELALCGRALCHHSDGKPVTYRQHVSDRANARLQSAGSLPPVLAQRKPEKPTIVDHSGDGEPGRGRHRAYSYMQKIARKIMARNPSNLTSTLAGLGGLYTSDLDGASFDRDGARDCTMFWSLHSPDQSRRKGTPGFYDWPTGSQSVVAPVRPFTLRRLC